MKILVKFLLSSVFVFLPAVCCAQDDFGLDKHCGFAPALKGFTVETRVWIDNKLIEEVSPQIVEMLEDGQNCLNDNLIGLKTSVESLHTQMGWNADSNLGFRNDIKDLQDKLKQTELDLYSAETKIETLENRLTTAEDEIQELKLYSRIPPHPTNRKAANKSSGFIPDTPATTHHPASKNSDSNKPKTPDNKPKPAV